MTGNNGFPLPHSCTINGQMQPRNKAPMKYYLATSQMQPETSQKSPTMKQQKINNNSSRSTEQLPFKSTHQPSNATFAISEFASTVAAAIQIKTTGALTKEAEAVLDVRDISLSPHEELVVNTQTFNIFNAAVQDLFSKATLLRRALMSVLSGPHDFSIDVKLPPTLRLSDLETLAHELEITLSQSLLNPYVKGDVTLTGFDRGSLWLEIGLGAPSAVTFLAGMVRLIFTIREHDLKLRAQKEMLSQLTLDNSLKVQLGDAFLSMQKAVFDENLRQLMASAGIPEDEHELWERVKYSLDSLGSLVSKGVEIHADLWGPKEEQALFPPAEKLLEMSQKLLAERGSSPQEPE